MRLDYIIATTAISSALGAQNLISIRSDPMQNLNRGTIELDFVLDHSRFEQPIKIDREPFFAFDQDFSNSLRTLESRYIPSYDGLPANMDFVAWL